MVYDCFPFFNELELLKIRLNVLKDVVDKFVLVEASWTHSGESKPLYFAQHKSEFSDFADRIIHVVVTGKPDMSSVTAESWAYENYQRNAISKGLVKAKDEDVVLISDVDEIPSVDFVNLVSESLRVKRSLVYIAEQMMCYYALNLRDVKEMSHWRGTRACTVEFLKNGLNGCNFSAQGESFCVVNRGTTATKLRTLGGSLEGPDVVPMAGCEFSFVPNSGWHFSYLMTPEKIAEKIKAFAHQEVNRPEIVDVEYIRRCIKSGKDLFGRMTFYEPLRLDSRFPDYLRENKEHYRAYIVPYSLIASFKARIFRVLVKVVRFLRAR